MNKNVRRVLIVIILLWTLFPFYSLLVTSVTTSGSIGDLFPEKITFEYYQEIFFGTKSGKPIWPFMKNSLIVGGLATIGVLVICVPCAYGFSRWDTKASHRMYLGFFILRIVRLIPVFGHIIWTAAALFGLGAILISEVNRRKTMTK